MIPTRTSHKPITPPQVSWFEFCFDATHSVFGFLNLPLPTPNEEAEKGLEQGSGQYQLQHSKQNEDEKVGKERKANIRGV